MIILRNTTFRALANYVGPPLVALFVQKKCSYQGPHGVRNT